MITLSWARPPLNKKEGCCVPLNRNVSPKQFSLTSRQRANPSLRRKRNKNSNENGPGWQELNAQRRRNEVKRDHPRRKTLLAAPRSEANRLSEPRATKPKLKCCWLGRSLAGMKAACRRDPNGEPRRPLEASEPVEGSARPLRIAGPEAAIEGGQDDVTV